MKSIGEIKELKGGCYISDLNTPEFTGSLLELSIVDAKVINHKELSAVRENRDGKCFLVPPDVTHGLAPYPENLDNLPEFNIEKVKDYLMADYQWEKRQEILKERQDMAKIIKGYLEESFNARIFATENKIMEGKAKDINGFCLTLKIGKELEDYRGKRREDKNVDDLTINEMVGESLSFFLFYHLAIPRSQVLLNLKKRKINKRRMEIVMRYERDRAVNLKMIHEEIGLYIRSLSPADPKTGYREVRRIEVKGRKKAQNIRLTVNEWLKGKQLRDTYWLYVVWNPTEDNYEMIRIPDPANKLEYAAKEIRAISHYEIDGKEIERLRGDEL